MTTSLLPTVETAAHHLVDRVPIAHGTESANSILDRLPGNTFDSLDTIYIVDEKSHLCGLVRLTDLLSMPREQRIGEVMSIGLVLNSFFSPAQFVARSLVLDSCGVTDGWKCSKPLFL